jgi:hypothetical protein
MFVIIIMMNNEINQNNILKIGILSVALIILLDNIFIDGHDTVLLLNVENQTPDKYFEKFDEKFELDDKDMDLLNELK